MCYNSLSVATIKLILYVDCPFSYAVMLWRNTEAAVALFKSTAVLQYAEDNQVLF